MEAPKKVSREEYDEFRSRMEDKYGYENMSDEEKEDFDAKIDQVAVAGDKTDKTDTTDTTDDEEKEAFDERIDKVVAKKDDETDRSETTESPGTFRDNEFVDNCSDLEKIREMLKSRYNYDEMSDGQKRAFDEEFYKTIGQNSEDEDPDPPEKVLRLIR